MRGLAGFVTLNEVCVAMGVTFSSPLFVSSKCSAVVCEHAITVGDGIGEPLHLEVTGHRTPRRVATSASERCGELLADCRHEDDLVVSPGVLEVRDVELTYSAEAVVEADATVSSEGASSYHEQVVQTKKRMITDAMKQANGNYTAAAKLLNLHPNYLHRLIRNLNMRDELKT